MNKFTHLQEFVEYIFDNKEITRKAKLVIEGLLKARSPRLSDIPREMAGNKAANYKYSNGF
jgi:hypothetical protein